jgi:hypothetical protein
MKYCLVAEIHYISDIQKSGAPVITLDFDRIGGAGREQIIETNPTRTSGTQLFSQI